MTYSLSIRDLRYWRQLSILALLLGSLASAPSRILAQETVPLTATQLVELQEALRLKEQSETLRREGRYESAIALAERVLTMVEKSLGLQHLAVAAVLNNLAELHRERGDYVRAKPLYLRSLAIREKKLGPDHPDVATSLGNLALLYHAQGYYTRAEALFIRALGIDEKSPDPDQRGLARDLNHLASLYQRKGDYARAEPLFLRSLAIVEKTLGPKSLDVAHSLNNLASLYDDKGDYARGAPLHNRALAIIEQTLGPEHFSVAGVLNNLAGLLLRQGDYAHAEQFYLRAVTILEKVRGVEHPTLATTLNNLGELYRRRGDFAGAEPFFQRSLAIREKMLGPGHSVVANTLTSLARLYDAKGDVTRAVQLQTRANDIREHNLMLNLASGSEQQKLVFMAMFSSETDVTVSLHTRSAPNDVPAAQLSLTTILRRKGRTLDAMTDQIGALRRRLDPQDRTLLDQLTAAQGQLSNLVFKGAGRVATAEYKADIAKLVAEVERLEAAISTRSAEFKVEVQPVTLEQVQRAIPAGAALVEIISYRPGDAKTNKYDAARYAAYVMRNDGAVLWTDLGEATAIEKDVARLRTVLADSRSTNSRQLARAMDERVMRPIRRLLGDTRRIFLSPDGVLNLIPFAAFVDERNRYLVEDFSITYLTTGRDLVRLQAQSNEKEQEIAQAPIVIADPLFNTTRRGAHTSYISLGADDEDNRRSIDLAKLKYSPLPGTKREAQSLKAIWPNAKVWTSREATESHLKSVASPRFLHVATHGFFLVDQPSHAPNNRQLLQDTAEQRLSLMQPGENPLLRSGLVLAGVMQRQSGPGEDGVLTALEAAGLDLRGTSLVVLSACETGLGDVKNGEGVYGLRRALVLAGSETQVISLWKVSDAGTRDLMTAYYTRLKNGEGRAEALRQVQLAMLRGQLSKPAGGGKRETSDAGEKPVTKDYRHPYYWAAFIQSGDWRSLDGKLGGLK